MLNINLYILRFTVSNPIALHNIAFHWLTSGFTSLAELPCCSKQYSLKGENVHQCIRMGMSVLKLSFGEVKSPVLWSQIAFYSSVDVPP